MCYNHNGVRRAPDIGWTAHGAAPGRHAAVSGLSHGCAAAAHGGLPAAKGTTVFTENIFTNRYRHAEEFRRLGAAVSIEGRVAYVTGVERLTGAPLTASDLRGGAAMLVAGLCAEGATELLDDGYIDRGDDRFDACLSALGADVRCAAPR